MKFKRQPLDKLKTKLTDQSKTKPTLRQLKNKTQKPRIK